MSERSASVAFDFFSLSRRFSLRRSWLPRPQRCILRSARRSEEPHHARDDLDVHLFAVLRVVGSDLQSPFQEHGRAAAEELGTGGADSIKSADPIPVGIFLGIALTVLVPPIDGHAEVHYLIAARQILHLGNVADITHDLDLAVSKHFLVLLLVEITNAGLRI